MATDVSTAQAEDDQVAPPLRRKREAGSPEGVPCTATMDLVLALPASALLAFVVLRRRREQTAWRPRRGRDNELVCAQLEAEAEMETHDTDDMLDAIGGYRRRQGRRDVGEELADDLMRGTWEE